MLERELEPEIMDTDEDALEYDSIPNDIVNITFMNEVLDQAPANASNIVDLGCGPAHIPILLALKNKEYAIHAVELAGSMISVAKINISKANLADRIALKQADIKYTSLPSNQFDIVLSNSVVHHVHQPVKIFSEAIRLASANSLIYFKDLLRPNSLHELESLVKRYASDVNSYQRQLFRQSLHASLTLDEVMACAEEACLKNAVVKQTSDRHWVMYCKRRD